MAGLLSTKQVPSFTQEKTVLNLYQKQTNKQVLRELTQSHSPSLLPTPCSHSSWNKGWNMPLVLKRPFFFFQRTQQWPGFHVKSFTGIWILYFLFFFFTLWFFISFSFFSLYAKGLLVYKHLEIFFMRDHLKFSKHCPPCRM